MSNYESLLMIKLVKLILSARSSIDLALFQITSEELSEAILEKIKFGINIR